MALDYDLFGDGGTTKITPTRTTASTATTPMNPDHPVDHNAYDRALNQIKSVVNNHTTGLTGWFAVDGVNFPWNLGMDASGGAPKGDTFHVSGLCRFSAEPGTSPVDTTSPVVTTQNLSGTVNANWHLQMNRVAALLWYVEIQCVATGTWSGSIGAVQIHMPTGFTRSPRETVALGFAHKGYPSFGVHFPIVGIMHGNGGDNPDGQENFATWGSGTPFFRFIVPDHAVTFVY